MERDSLLAHGTSFLLHDRLMKCSDDHRVQTINLTNSSKITNNNKRATSAHCVVGCYPRWPEQQRQRRTWFVFIAIARRESNLWRFPTSSDTCRRNLLRWVFASPSLLTRNKDSTNQSQPRNGMKKTNSLKRCEGEVWRQVQPKTDW